MTVITTPNDVFVIKLPKAHSSIRCRRDDRRRIRGGRQVQYASRVAAECRHRGAQRRIPDLRMVLGEPVGADNLIRAGRPVERADLRSRVHRPPVHARGAAAHVPKPQLPVRRPTARHEAPAGVWGPRDGLDGGAVPPKVSEWCCRCSLSQPADVPDGESVVVTSAGEESPVWRPRKTADLLAVRTHQHRGGRGCGDTGVVKVNCAALSSRSQNAAVVTTVNEM